MRDATGWTEGCYCTVLGFKQANFHRDIAVKRVGDFRNGVECVKNKERLKEDSTAPTRDMLTVTSPSFLQPYIRSTARIKLLHSLDSRTLLISTLINLNFAIIIFIS